MKECTYCGRENKDEAAYCFECGTGFPVPDTGPDVCEPKESRIPISLRARVGLWIVAWITIATVMTILNPHYLRFVWFWPAGLIFLWPIPLEGGGILIVGWLCYVALTVWGLCSRYRARYLFVYGVLCVSLIANGAGCHWLAHQDFGQ